MATKEISRRGFLTRAGALVVSFTFAPAVVRALISADPAQASTTTGDTTQVDSWLAIGSDSHITVYCGKVELGTGVQTALIQIVAEELYLNPATYLSQITWVQGDTSLTPNQGYTAGSQTVQTGGVQLRQAAATAFQTLVTWAGSTSAVLSLQGIYGPLVQSHGGTFSTLVNTKVATKSPSTYTIVGQSVQRVDLPGKFTGQFTYVQDVVVPNMLHGRVVRPAGRNATLSGTPSLPAGLLGSPSVFTKGNFVGVVATDEWSAIQAASNLSVSWNPGAPLAATDDGTPATRNALISALQNPLNIDDSPPGGTILSPPAPTGNVVTGLAGAATKLQATYFTPYHMHAAIGPSCAVASVLSAPDPVTGIQATIWSGTQGVTFLQGAIAQLLGLSTAAVHVIYVEASGCYGHNGADDAAADAALLSQLSGAPVRVQWMRPDEHGWEPLGSAMVHQMQGGLDANRNVLAWKHTLWTQTHNTRPGGLAGNLLAGQELGFLPQADAPVGANLGGRNSGLNYVFPNYQVSAYNVKSYNVTGSGPNSYTTTNVLPRTTALRSLGGLSNTFANESFMDELALAAKADPLAFRLKYLSDPRAIAVLNAMATQAGWGSTPATPPAGLLFGHGIAYVQYENSYAYVAAYAEVLVNLNSGAIQVTRVVIAHDCGLIINPDGLENQIQGNVIQAASRGLKEEVLFNANGVTSLTWAGAPAANTWSINYVPGPAYQIFHFTDVPSVEIVLINQPTQPAWGSGEPVTEAMPAVIGNAFYNATRLRLRNLPFTPANVLAALVPGNGTSGTSSISSSWSGQNVVSGDYLWFNGHLKLTNVPQQVTYPIIITVTNQQITGDGGAGATASAPSATIIITNGTSIGSAVFGNGQWVITVPSSDINDDEISIGGLALPVTSSAWNASRNVTWKATFASNTPGLGVQWVWSAAQYKQPGFSANTPPQASDYNNLMVKPTHHGTEYNNGDHAGTPENTVIRALLVSGPRGGAGSNYTGGWSSTGSVGTLGSIGS
jgi:nicotinate dehydrogenase subunit B